MPIPMKAAINQAPSPVKLVEKQTTRLDRWIDQSRRSTVPNLQQHSNPVQNSMIWVKKYRKLQKTRLLDFYGFTRICVLSLTRF